MGLDRVARFEAGMNVHISKPLDKVRLVSLIIRLTGANGPGPT